MFERIAVTGYVERWHLYFNGARAYVAELHFSQRLTLGHRNYFCDGAGGRLLMRKLTAKEVRFTVLEVARETCGIFEQRPYTGVGYV
jgi:hypothetical protein